MTVDRSKIIYYGTWSSDLLKQHKCKHEYRGLKVIKGLEFQICINCSVFINKKQHPIDKEYIENYFKDLVAEKSKYESFYDSYDVYIGKIPSWILKEERENKIKRFKAKIISFFVEPKFNFLQLAGFGLLIAFVFGYVYK